MTYCVRKPGVLGSVIKAIRQRQGITLPRLAILAGVSKGRISKIENGDDNIELSTLFLIAGVLEMRPSQLVDLIPTLADDRREQLKKLA